MPTKQAIKVRTKLKFVCAKTHSPVSVLSAHTVFIFRFPVYELRAVNRKNGVAHTLYSVWKLDDGRIRSAKGSFFFFLLYYMAKANH